MATGAHDKLRGASQPEPLEALVTLPHHLYYEDEVDLREYLRPLVKRWRFIAAVTVLAMAATGSVTGFLLPRYYRAEAVIRPVAQPALQGRLAGRLSSFGGSSGAGLGGIAAAVGGGGGSDAEEYLPILKSYPFVIALVKKHHLWDRMLEQTQDMITGRLPEHPSWAIYYLMKKRFSAEYSLKTGNVTVAYEDRDRAQAEQILSYFIDDLREKLRARQIDETTAAAQALREEAAATSDALLQAHLYELMARQLERKKLAQVQADFAFVVLVPPNASVKPYRPKVVLDTAIAGMLALILAMAWVLLREPSAERAPSPALGRAE